jgi:hypothetical protein
MEIKKSFWAHHRIQIKHNASFKNPSYANCIPLSIHPIIDPPKRKRNGVEGMWVMGVDRPVFVLYSKLTLMPGMIKPVVKLKRTNKPSKLVRTK